MDEEHFVAAIDLILELLDNISVEGRKNVFNLRGAIANLETLRNSVFAKDFDEINPQ